MKISLLDFSTVEGKTLLKKSTEPIETPSFVALSIILSFSILITIRTITIRMKDFSIGSHFNEINVISLYSTYSV